MTDQLEAKIGTQDPRNEPVSIPHDSLSSEALDGLIREYLVREVSVDSSEDPMVYYDSMVTALREGKAVIWFYPETHDFTIIMG